MYIKFIILAILNFIIVTQNSFGQINNTVYLSGTIKNYNNQVQIEDMSEMRDLKLPDNERTFILDSNNHFAISFTLNKAGYFRIGRNILYLQPKDSLNMEINWVWRDSSIFKGIGSEANEYLKFTPFPKGGSFLEGDLHCELTIDKTINEILRLAQNRRIELKNCININEAFRSLETTRIEADILNSIIMIPTYFVYKYNITKDSFETFKALYHKIATPYIYNYSKSINFDQKYLQLGVYRQIISGILTRIKGYKAKRSLVEDWLKASDLIDNLKVIKEKANIEQFKVNLNDIKTLRYRNAVAKSYKKLVAFTIGDIAKDFEMIDANNNKVALSSFKGKIIYINLWATWCGPCLEEMPYLDSLKKRFDDGEQIVFISLSIDDFKQKWLDNITHRKALHNQFNIDRLNLESYSVTEVPRVIIINKSFKIEAMYGSLPSRKNTMLILDKLLQ